MTNRRFALQVALAFFALYTIWGSTYLAIQLAGREVPPLLMAGARFVVAGTLLLLLALAFGKVRRGDFTRRNWIAAFVVGIGLMLVGNGGVALAVQRIPTGISAVIIATTPMWLVLFDWAQRRRGRPSNAVIVGILLGIAGVATLKLAAFSSDDKPLDLLGLLFNVAAPVGWAAGSIYSRTAPRAASPVTACAMQMFMGGLLLLAVSPIFETWTSVRVEDLTWKFWTSWWYLIVFGSLCGFTAYIWLLQHVSAAKVSTYAYVNPIIALVIGATINHERFTPTQMLACTLIVAGVVVITAFRARASAVAAEKLATDSA